MSKNRAQPARLAPIATAVRRTAGVQKNLARAAARTALRRAPGGAARAASGIPNLAQTAYERIKADIFDFRLPPGGRFSENEIAAQIGVSRTPVREALSRLARDGFLEVYAKSGWRVRPLDFDRFDQLYDVRVVLELAALRKLCAGSPGEALDPLKRVWLVAPRLRSQDAQQVAGLDEEFHATLLRATGNDELARIYADVTERIRIVRRLDFTQPERITRTYDEHAAILRAVLTRKTQQAELLMGAHIEASKLEVRKISLHRLHLAERAGASRAPEKFD